MAVGTIGLIPSHSRFLSNKADSADTCTFNELRLRPFSNPFCRNSTIDTILGERNSVFLFHTNRESKARFYGILSMWNFSLLVKGFGLFCLNNLSVSMFPAQSPCRQTHCLAFR
ncbi:hypothetical protein FKM82_020322 [Ascaphus truei]